MKQVLCEFCKKPFRKNGRAAWGGRNSFFIHPKCYPGWWGYQELLSNQDMWLHPKRILARNSKFLKRGQKELNHMKGA